MSDDEYVYDDDTADDAVEDPKAQRRVLLATIIANLTRLPWRGRAALAQLGDVKELREQLGEWQAFDDRDDYAAAVAAITSAAERVIAVLLQEEYRHAQLRFAVGVATQAEIDRTLMARLVRAKEWAEAHAGAKALRVTATDDSDVGFLVQSMRMSQTDAAAATAQLRDCPAELSPQLAAIARRLAQRQAAVAARGAEREAQLRARLEDPRNQALLARVGTMIRVRRRAQAVRHLVTTRASSPCRTACQTANKPHGIVVYFRDSLGKQTYMCVDADALYAALQQGGPPLKDVDGAPINLGARQVARAARLLRQRCFPIQVQADGRVTIQAFPAAEAWVTGSAVVDQSARPYETIGLTQASWRATGHYVVEAHSRNAAVFRPWASAGEDDMQTAWAMSFVDGAAPYGVDTPHALLSISTAHALGISTGDVVRWRIVQPPVVTKLVLTGRVDPGDDPEELSARIGVANVLYTGMTVNGLRIHDMAPACVGVLPGVGAGQEVAYEVVSAAKLERAAAAVAAQRQAAAARAFVDRVEVARMLSRNPQGFASSAAGAGAGAGAGSAGAAAVAAVTSDDQDLCAICQSAVDDRVDHPLSCGRHYVHDECYAMMHAQGMTGCPYGCKSRKVARTQ